MKDVNEVTISRYTAAKIIKEYLEEYYNGIVNVKVKPKLEDNDLVMQIKENSNINGVKISKTRIINQGKISEMIMNYYSEISQIMYEPNFHNLIIRYNNEINLNDKKKTKIKTI